MNIFEQYGIKEVMDACLYAIELDENENEIYVPVLYLDTLKVSTVEQSAQSVSAQGGLGNPKLITWDYGKDIKVQLEDALFTPAQQSMTWTGKLGAKGLKLYLRNFWDRTQQMPAEDEINQIIELHPEWVINLSSDNYYLAYKEWLNKHGRGATLNIKNFSDFCIIPDRIGKQKNKYVGGTSIFCWLCDGYVIANDDQNKIVFNDLIVFFREQTQKWYFFNGGGTIKRYKDNFSTTDYRHYGIGYQYGKDTFQWIRENLTRTKFDLRSYDGHTYQVNGVKDAPVLLRFSSDTESIVKEHQYMHGSFHNGIVTVYNKDSLNGQEIDSKWELEVDPSLIRFNLPVYADNDNDFFAYENLASLAIGKIENNVYIPPIKINDRTPSGGYYGYTYDEKTNRWYMPGGGLVTIGSCSYRVYLPVSEIGQDYQGMVNFVLTHHIFIGDGTPTNVEEKEFDWEPVSAATRRAWGEKIDIVNTEDDYDQVNFLTQNLYIDGYKINECAKSLKFSEDIETELLTTNQPCRYEASVDLEYNTNIALPAEALYQIEHGYEKVDFLERIEKCITKKQFCINTDVNLKHGEQRYLHQYDEKELTVYINPKTMQPYVPNGFEYITKDNKRITGNLKIFKQGETYYKWTRTKAKRCESLGDRLIIDAQHFPGVYRFVGETFIRSRTDGKDYRAQFEIPKCKLTANNNIQLQADGDPTTFNMELTALQMFDGTMMKLTFYEIDDKICNGSTKVIPHFTRPDFEEVNADWRVEPSFEIDAPETIDLAAFLLEPEDDEYRSGLNKQRRGDD